MPFSVICCDASLIFRLVTGTSQAISIVWDDWTRQRISFVAPLLFRYELTNACDRPLMSEVGIAWKIASTFSKLDFCYLFQSMTTLRSIRARCRWPTAMDCQQHTMPTTLRQPRSTKRLFGLATKSYSTE